MQTAEAYFDESGSHKDSPLLCVAGYIIQRDARIRLDAEWGQVLQKFGLPFFRMSACAHGTKPFHVLSMEQRIEAEKELIAITRRYISCGIAITVDPKAYESIVPIDSQTVGTAYSLCVHACLTAVKSWAAETKFDGEISYIFEDGHASRAEADAIMNRLFRVSAHRKSHHYGSHQFEDKKKIRPLQAADLIAWQWFTDQKRRMECRSPYPRLDCIELMISRNGTESFFHALHLEEHMLRTIAETVLRGRYPLTYVDSKAM